MHRHKSLLAIRLRLLCSHIILIGALGFPDKKTMFNKPM